ncbi:LysR family transcriptional regulator [Massilia atriviolacea]|uniref:LysR family transcriptional regulator n=1 Tax=Massilia atriviolacea TaxID=2495579 RepID=A0A430HSS7_9BURK|nr:LysR family transcriptional regulator [Massilia atriviolacea]RSZ60598.1 LysR family transcriptional regulator [Massilia atriviolacea]
MPNLRQLDLNLLKALDALLDERNVTRAAARLGLTQPAMSGMLTRLRESFDDPLLVRVQRGVAPTPRALALAAPVKQVLADIAGLLQPQAFDPATARMTLSIAATDYALRAIAVPFLLALRPLAPSIRVALLPVVNEQLQAQLEQGLVDLALGTPETTAPDLHARILFEERYVCVMRSGHPAAPAPQAGLSLDQFCALDHALVSYAGGSFEGVSDEALARLGRQRRVMLSVKSFLLLPDILRASDLVAVVPRRLVDDADGLVLCEPPLDIPGLTKVLAWHERTHRDPGHRWLRALLLRTSGARA